MEETGKSFGSIVAVIFCDTKRNSGSLLVRLPVGDVNCLFCLLNSFLPDFLIACHRNLLLISSNLLFPLEVKWRPLRGCALLPQKLIVGVQEKELIFINHDSVGVLWVTNLSTLGSLKEPKICHD